jgi:hypothetical protein
MKPQTITIAQFLNVTNFPFIIKDKNGKLIYLEYSDGYWLKREYDDQGNQIRFENSDGEIVDKRPKPMVELTLEDIAKLKGVSMSQIRIKE